MGARRWVAVVGIVGAVGALVMGAPRSATGPVLPHRAPQAPEVALVKDDQPGPDPTGCLASIRPIARSALRGLPWPVVMTTSCGTFVVFRTGAMERGAVLPGAEPSPGYRIPAGPNAWARVDRGHVVFRSRGTTVWRSSGAAYEPDRIDNAVLGGDWAAFTEYGAEGDASRMYLARLDGPERAIGLNEAALTATRWGGLMVSQWKDNGVFDIVAMRSDGSLLRVVATDVPYGDPRPDGTITYRVGRTFIRTDGLRETVVATTDGLGRPRDVGMTNLADGRMVVSGPDRLRLLGAGGQIEVDAAVAPIPKGGWGYLAEMAVQPGTRAIVFTATHWNDASAGGGTGWEGVYRLAPGDTHATLLFGRRLKIAVCAHSVSMSWRGSWLLYSACEGRVVAIDATGHHHAIVLNGLARAIPMPAEERRYGLFGAQWAAFASPAQMPTVARLR